MRIVVGLFAALMVLCESAHGDPWRITADHIDPHRYFGETVANGTIGLTSSARPFKTQQTLLYGAFAPVWRGSVPVAARSFNFLNLGVRIDGTAIVSASQVRNFRQALDFKKAVLITSFDYGDRASVTCALRALRELPYSALLDVTVSAHKTLRLQVAAQIEAPEPGEITWFDSHTFPWLQNVRRSVKDVAFGSGDLAQVVRVSSAQANGATGSMTIAAAQTFLFENLHTAPVVSSGKGTVSFSQEIHAGEEFQFASLGSTLTSAHVADPANEVQRLTAEAGVRGLKSLIAGHERAWTELWKSDVLIQGDEDAQRDIHGIIYHLYESVREGTAYSIPPMGLSGSTNDYLGHIFWDAEAWMLPGLLALHPELARSMLEYRFERLGAARRNAARHGYRGAQYPWESAETGDEDTWVEASTGVMELHVTADVALAAWNYFRVTQDKDWLVARGFPMIEAAADFWVSRVSREGPGRYCIRHVTAVDEGADNVDNDAFTNAAVKENLRVAEAAARLLGKMPDPDWAEVAANIPIEKFPDGVTREHEAYRSEQPWHGDVMLLAYPLEVITDRAQVERDLAYYDADRNDDKNGPGLMEPISAMIYERLGQPQRAYEMLNRSYFPNRRPPFGVIAESATGDNPYFLTGVGAVLQTMLYGFGGLRITDEGLRQVPAALPPSWRSITLTGMGPEAKTFVQKLAGGN